MQQQKQSTKPQGEAFTKEQAEAMGAFEDDAIMSEAEWLAEQEEQQSQRDE